MHYAPFVSEEKRLGIGFRRYCARIDGAPTNALLSFVSLPKLQGTSGQQTLTAKRRLSRQSLLLYICERLPGRWYANRAANTFSIWHLMSLAFADDFGLLRKFGAEDSALLTTRPRSKGQRPPPARAERHAKRLFVKVQPAR